MNKKILLSSLAVLVFAVSSTSAYCADNNCPKDRPQAPFHQKNGNFPPRHFDGNHKYSPAEFHHGMKAHNEDIKKFHEQRRAEMEKRLKLTDEQKKQIEENRKQDIEKIKPIMEQIKTKHDEYKKIEQSNLTQAEKDKQLKQLKNELKELKGQADSLRRNNMKSFESVLTEKQQKEFVQIKAEQKQEMEKKIRKDLIKKAKNFKLPE